MNPVPFREQGNIFHFSRYLKDYFYWENLFMKDGFRFKAEIQHRTTRDTWKARKVEREGRKEEGRERKEDKEKKHYFLVEEKCFMCSRHSSGH